MRAIVLATAIGLSAVGLSSASDTQAAVRHSINIPAQDLCPALQTLAKEHNFQLVYRSEFVRDVRTAGAVGELTSEEALTRLLQGTGLTHRRLDDKTMTIAPLPTMERPRGEASSRSPQGRETDSEEGRRSEGKEKEKSFWDRFRLAQVDQAKPASDRSLERSNTVSERKAARIEEVIVTAQRREERTFDVPISIVAMSADELQKRNVTAIDDLSLAVPGLFVSSNGSYTRQIMLRGIGNVFGNSSLIGLYLDEASVTSGPFLQLDLRTYDLERVEVLRGPQGTLYGEGSVGGTIRFITKNPLLDQFAINADVAALVTRKGAAGQRIEGVLNVPLIKNELGLRIVGTYDHQGGWIDQPAADRKNYNDQNLSNVRIKGLWQPTPQFTVNAMAVIHRNDAPPNIGEDDNGDYTQAFNLTTTPSANDDYDLYNVTLAYDFPAAQVLSTTSYLEQNNELRDFGVLRQFTPPGTPPFHIYLPVQKTGSKILTEELRLTSIGSGPWQWTVGGFYRRARFATDFPEFFFGLSGPPGTPLPDPFLNIQLGALSKSWAVFGDVSYELTNRLTFGSGLRYFQDDQEDRVSDRTARFDAVNPRVYAQYKLTDQVNTYASAAKGFRSGGFNAATQPTYDPESVWTYELGTKMSLVNGRLSIDAAIFYSDYTNYQIVGIPPDDETVGNITSNAGNAAIKGVEWALTWRPVDQWSLSVNGNYVDSGFYEIDVTSSSHARGDPLDVFPKYGYTVSAQRDFEWNGRPGFTRVDYNKHGRATFRNRSIGPWYFNESEVIDMLNFNASLRWNDNFSLGLFAQNLLNDRGFVTIADPGGFATRSRPRTFGIEFGVTF